MSTLGTFALCAFTIGFLKALFRCLQWFDQTVHQHVLALSFPTHFILNYALTDNNIKTPSVLFTVARK